MRWSTTKPNSCSPVLPAFLDPPKESAGKRSRRSTQAALRSRSSPATASWSRGTSVPQLDIPITGVLTGSEIAAHGRLALAVRVEKANLFCRVTPAQKNRIILALKSRGHVVGYLGDGINDAPSLHSADVGISVDTAVDVAKEAADMILLQAGSERAA